MYALAELDGFATGIAVVLGLVTFFAPFLNRIRHLDAIQFGFPGVMNFLAEIATITISLSVIYYKDWLHLLPPFFLWIVLGIVGFLAMLGLATYAKRNSMQNGVGGPRPMPIWVIIAGGGLYIVSLSFLWFGVVHASAELVMFRHIEGDVRTERVEDMKGVSVILSIGSATRLLRTETDTDGHYRYLLTFEEYSGADEIQFQKYHSDNPNSLVLVGQNKCISTERTCYVSTITLQ